MYEEAAPLATYENGINAVLKDFHDQYLEGASDKNPSSHNFIPTDAISNRSGVPSMSNVVWSFASKRSCAISTHRETFRI